MFCPYCGENIAENSKFCPKCGESLTEEKKGKIVIPKKLYIGLTIILLILGFLYWNNQQGGALLNPIKRAIPIFGTIYPDDYILKDNEIPSGFYLRPVDEPMRKAGISNNPGFVEEWAVQMMRASGESFVTGIDKSYFAFYTNSDKTSDLMIAAFRYTSQEALDLAIEEALDKKEFPTHSIVLRDNTVLVIISGETSSDNEAVKWIADKLKARVNLLEVSSLENDDFFKPQTKGVSDILITPTSIPTPQPTPTKKLEANKEELLSGIEENRPTLGSSQAKVAIVVFDDFQCPFCKKFTDETFPSIKSTYIDTGKVQLTFRNFPLDFHKNARSAAIAAMCAEKQGKFWEYHDKLFSSQTEWQSEGDPKAKLISYGNSLQLDSTAFLTCLNNKETAGMIDEDIQLGKDLGITGTPGFYINDTELVGAVPFSKFQEVIEKELNE